MSISHTAVKRPVATLMVILAMLVIGLVALVRIPVALMPDLDLPFAVVVTQYPNVGPFEIENQVTRPIEEAMGTVSNVKNVQSISLTGQSTVIVEFNWGTDLDFATLEMREKVDQVLGQLPSDVEQPRIFRFDPTQEPMFRINVASDMDLATLREFVDDNIRKRLERVEGVARVTIVGGLEREIQVRVDPTRLEQYGLTFQQVNQALAASNLNLPGGRVNEGDREWIVRTVGEFQSVEEIEQVVVYAGPNGVVRLSDVATVVDGYKDVDRMARLNGLASVALAVQRESSSNTVRVSDRLLREVAALQAELGSRVTLQVIWDDAEFIRSSINSVVENALTGAILAALVLLAFLRSWRSTLVIATSIPVAGVATFAMLYFSDTSLNMLSLGGLALGVGMLVDNSIVVLENIFRHREEGSEIEKAAGDGAQEVTGALWGSTLTTVAVFLPVAFLEGITAEIFRDLAFAVSFSVLASLVVAVAPVPMMAARFLRGENTDWASEIADPSKASVDVNDPYREGRGAFGRFQARYARWISALLRRRWLAVAWILLVLVLAGFAGSRMGMEFMPQMDTGDFTMSVQLPAGSALAETSRVVQQVEEFLYTIDEVEYVFSDIGGGRSNQASISVDLVPKEQRTRSTQQVLEQVRQFAQTVPGATISARMMSHVGSGGPPVQVLVKGDDLDELARYSEWLAEQMRHIPGLREVDTSLSEARPELQVRVKRDRAASLGLNVFQIASSLRAAVEGEVGTRYRIAGDEIDVRVRLDEAYRNSIFALGRILIDTPLGIQVPLHEVADIVEGESPVEITRDGQQRVVRVEAQLHERDLGSAMADIQRVVASHPLPAGITVEYGGENEMMQEAFQSLFLALLLSIALVYMIMAFQFESLTQPFIIMITVPLAIAGAVMGLAFTGKPLSVPAFVGIIMLGGIVVNNGIVLVDYTNQLRARGLERTQAIVLAARVRLRPVLMTTSTTVLGMLPLALGIGEGSEIQAPIAIVVVAGLSLATLLTLGVVPVLYSMLTDFEAWWARLWARPSRPAKAAGARS